MLVLAIIVCVWLAFEQWYTLLTHIYSRNNRVTRMDKGGKEVHNLRGRENKWELERDMQGLWRRNGLELLGLMGMTYLARGTSGKMEKPWIIWYKKLNFRRHLLLAVYRQFAELYEGAISNILLSGAHPGSEMLDFLKGWYAVLQVGVPYDSSVFKERSYMCYVQLQHCS